MKIQRTIPLVVKRDDDLQSLISEYSRWEREISAVGYNVGKPLHAILLQKQVYHTIPTTLPSTMKCSAIRTVAASYASAKKNGHPATKPFSFIKESATFLYNKDFSFVRDKNNEGKQLLSISTSVGRKKLSFVVPDHFKNDFSNAYSHDSITVTGQGKVWISLTLEVPDPTSVIPVGIDMGVNVKLVASTEKKTLFVSGSKLNQLNKRTRKVRQRLQKKLAVKKAQRSGTRSVRRVLKRLGRKQRNRSLTFCKDTASRLCKWSPSNAVLVFEDLEFEQVDKNDKKRKGTHRKLSQWFYSMMISCCRNKAERTGLGLDFTNPAYTSQKCRKCGMLGVRFGHRFECKGCGHKEHSDINASHNIRQNYAVLRGGGVVSTTPEALSL